MRRQVIRRIDVAVREVHWSDSGELVAILGEQSFYVLRFAGDVVETFFESGQEPDEDGIDDAFELLNEVSEHVRTGGCPPSRLKCVGGSIIKPICDVLLRVRLGGCPSKAVNPNMLLALSVSTQRGSQASIRNAGGHNVVELHCDVFPLYAPVCALLNLLNRRVLGHPSCFGRFPDTLTIAGPMIVLRDIRILQDLRL